MTRHPWTPTIREHRRTTQALSRAVQRPSLWERAPGQVMKPDECVRCYGQLEPGRNSVCRSCHEDPT